MDPWSFACLAITALIVGDAKSGPNGNATSRGKAGSSEIVITTTDRLAGAIDSLTWGGKDHGRQLQSAPAADRARPVRRMAIRRTL